MDELTKLRERIAAAEERLSKFNDIYYFAPDRETAKRERAGLVSAQNKLHEARHALRAVAPALEADESQRLRELNRRIEHQLIMMRDFIRVDDELGKNKRKTKLLQYFDRESSALGVFADDIRANDALIKRSWLDLKTLPGICRREMSETVDRIARELDMLSNEENAPALIAYYLGSLSLDGIEDYKRRLKLASAPELGIVAKPICSFGAYDKPDRMDFVAFDLEISGTFGVASGDKPAEIIEFGAVKYENGVEVDRFSCLCDPGRHITQSVVDLTGITEEMVENAPPVADAMRAFAKFAGDFLLVGHGIRNSDLIYLKRCAENSGLSMNNDCFDTFVYAKSIAEKAGFESLKLGNLAASLGIEHAESHRALSDAECTGKVYVKLSALGA